uniref:Solute carrier family 25 member 3 n=1 Tax=Salvator merianae TaxID=96440 RepID=A0A8D0BMA1_SALMN
MFSSIVPLTRLNPFHAPQLQLQPESLTLRKRSLAAASAEEEYSCEYGSLKFYALCGFGGVLSCGLIHTAVVPLDLVKCHIQVDPQTYKSIFNGFSVTLKEDGVHGLGKGWAPTIIGYSMQGSTNLVFMKSSKSYMEANIQKQSSLLLHS